MIKGLGTDIVEIQRIKKICSTSFGDNFIRRILTDEEIKEMQQKSPEKQNEFLAGRWAAKEAVAKALGCGIGGRCSFLDLHIINNDAGAPELHFTGDAADELRSKGASTCHISIRHEIHYATAVAIIE